MRLKFEFGLCLVFSFALVLSACDGSTGPASPSLNLTILHTNNVEGELDPCLCVSDPAGGAARRSSAVSELRKQFPNLFLVDAGDALFGTPESDDSQGLAMVETMNAMAYDAAVLGDQEFSYGLATLEAVIHKAQFPYLSANIVRRDTKQPFVKESVIVERGGYRVAFIGLTTEDVDQILQADPVMQNNLQVLDPIQTARQTIPQLREQADIVIVLSHLGSELDQKLVGSVPGIDAVIGAHSREVTTVAKETTTVPIVQVGYQGDMLGVLKLTANGKGQTISAQSENIHLNRDVASDTHIQAVLIPYKSKAALNGTIIFYQGLSPLLPLEVHRADRNTQRAYLGALAYPELFEAEAYPGDDTQQFDLSKLANPEPLVTETSHLTGINRAEDLLACFINKTDTEDDQVEFTILAITEMKCVQQANAILDALPEYEKPTRIGNP